MGSIMKTRRTAEAFPPGGFIKDELEAREWLQTDLADIIGRNTGTVSQVISGKQPINPELARALGAAFGTSAEYWMNLQTAYELWKSQEGSDETAIQRRAYLHGKVPLKELLKRRWVESSESVDVLEQRVCEFLEIPTITEEAVMGFAARKTGSYNGPAHPSLVAWMKRAKFLAKGVHAKRYSEKKLKDALAQLRVFIQNAEDVRQVPRLLAEAGVRLVVVEHLPQTKVDGVTFWLDKNSPVIVLSLRYDRLDWFWHTLLHELDHVLHGEGFDSPCVDDLWEKSSSRPPQEVRCDYFAANFSIEQAALEDFIVRIRPYFTPETATGFAMRMRVHPAVVAGQIRNRLQNYSVLSTLVSTKIRALLLDSVMCDGWGHTVNLQS